MCSRYALYVYALGKFLFVQFLFKIDVCVSYVCATIEMPWRCLLHGRNKLCTCVAVPFAIKSADWLRTATVTARYETMDANLSTSKFVKDKKANGCIEKAI